MATWIVKRLNRNLASKLTFLRQEEEKQKKYSLKTPSNNVFREANRNLNKWEMASNSFNVTGFLSQGS